MILFKFLLISLTVLFFGCSRDNELSSNNSLEEKQILTASDLITNDNGLSTSKVILRTIHGNLSIYLYPLKAPNTVTRFLHLVHNGFYNGLVFHRVIPNFVIQTGDPNGDGTGGSGQKLKAEFNDQPHILGTVAMARSKDVDSADSQFYIALTTLPHLDKNYTVFGQVVDGTEVLSKISKGDKIISASIVK